MKGGWLPQGLRCLAACSVAEASREGPSAKASESRGSESTAVILSPWSSSRIALTYLLNLKHFKYFLFSKFWSSLHCSLACGHDAVSRPHGLGLSEKMNKQRDSLVSSEFIISPSEPITQCGHSWSSWLMRKGYSLAFWIFQSLFFRCNNPAEVLDQGHQT